MEYEEFEKELNTKFPEMYQDVRCGISIDKGWYQIILSLSENIYYHVKTNNTRRNQLLENNPYNYKIPEYKDFPKVVQIKEKFGGLRFYTDNTSDDFVEGSIRMAEYWSDHTCERCGKPGVATKTGWIKVLCEEHNKRN